jgi:hypothetical protein
VFLTSLIDAFEGRDVATVDIPGAFMQADMDDLVHPRLTGSMVDPLLEIDQEIMPHSHRRRKRKGIVR